ncbi:MAG: hypothetical protein J7K77_00200 [Dehalococcoidales bacterium]|nr:hypothetical protein [Dehalococcoidales bacterium]
MLVTKLDITHLKDIVAALPAEEKARFQRIYAVNTTEGSLCIPPTMEDWVTQQFGSVAAVTHQQIVRVANGVTVDETLFNPLRGFRPTQGKESANLKTQLARASIKDLFANPEANTPADSFGRVKGKYCITASNVAKYDSLHSIVIFNDFHPLHFSREQIIDYLDTAIKWARQARASKPEAKYFFLIWNCLWPAGASICHGHAQVMLAQERHYARIERLRQAALGYHRRYGANYFDDLFQAHRSVGCAMEKEGVRIMAHLTPFKDNEVVLLGDALNRSFKARVYEILACFRDRLGVTSFNFSLVTPPLAETEEDWTGFPVMARLVERGNPDSGVSDIGGMEIYAASVVSSDPFELAWQLREYLGVNGG